MEQCGKKALRSFTSMIRADQQAWKPGCPFGMFQLCNVYVEEVTWCRRAFFPDVRAHLNDAGVSMRKIDVMKKGCHVVDFVTQSKHGRDYI